MKPRCGGQGGGGNRRGVKSGLDSTSFKLWISSVVVRDREKGEIGIGVGWRASKDRANPQSGWAYSSNAF